MTDIFDSVFEIINIHKSLIICRDDAEVFRFKRALEERDYSVSDDFEDPCCRMVIMDLDTFDHTDKTVDLWEDYNVAFVSDQVRRIMHELGFLRNVQMIVVFNSEVEIDV